MRWRLYLQRIEKLFDLFVEKRGIVAKVRTVRVPAPKKVKSQDAKSGL
jgi:hypothetical protein